LTNPVFNQPLISINQLPPEILSKIFNHFFVGDLSTVRAAAKVCTLWNNLLENRTHWNIVYMEIYGVRPESIMDTKKHLTLSLFPKKAEWKRHLWSGDFARSPYHNEILEKVNAPVQFTSTFLAQHQTINGENFRGIATTGPRANKIILFNSDTNRTEVIKNLGKAQNRTLMDVSVLPINNRNALVVLENAGPIQLFWPEKPKEPFGFLQKTVKKALVHSFVYLGQSFIALRSSINKNSKEYDLCLFRVDENGVSKEPTEILTGMKGKALKVVTYRNQGVEYIVSYDLSGRINCWNPKLNKQPLWTFSIKEFINSKYSREAYRVQDNYYDLNRAIPLMVVTNEKKDDILLTRCVNGYLIILRPMIDQTPISLDEITLAGSENIARISIVKSPAGRPYAVGFCMENGSTYLRSWSLDDGKMSETQHILGKISEHTLLHGPGGPYLILTHRYRNDFREGVDVSFWSLFKGEDFIPFQIKLIHEAFALKTITPFPSLNGYDNILAEYWEDTKIRDKCRIKKEFILWDFTKQEKPVSYNPFHYLKELIIKKI
jgi:F-box-like